MLIPIGHEESEVRRLPWVSIAIGVTCIVVFWLAGRGETKARERSDEAFSEIVQYYYQHPYLEADEELTVFGDWVVMGYELEEAGVTSGGDDVDPIQREIEQETLDQLTEIWSDSRESIPIYRWGLIPNKLQIGDLITSIFMHAGLMHLIGNLMFFWLSGPPLEDVWGRPIFAVFFLVSGLVGGLLWVARYSESGIPLVGASGAVAGLMGAFMVRFWTSKIRMFYFFFVGFRFFTGTFSSPAWVMLGLWFATELFWATALDSTAGQYGGVANLVHVGGFAFGAGTAALIRHLKTEEKVFQPKIDAKLGGDVNTVIEKAHELRQEGKLEEAWQLLATEAQQHPTNWDAGLALWDIALQMDRPQDAKDAFLRCIQQDLRRGEPDLACLHWSELTEHLPDVESEVDINFKVHLAEAFLEEEREDEAAALLATLDETLALSMPMGARTRLARVTARVRSANAPEICKSVLSDQTLPMEVRQEIRQFLDQAQTRGLRPPPGQEAPAAPPDAPLPVSEEAPAHRILKVMPATPKGLTGEKISVDVAGQGARLLPLKNIQAVAAARVDSGGQDAFLVIDLLVDSLWSDKSQIRTVRMRSNEFDACTIIGSPGDQHQALVAFIDNLVTISDATPIPDAESVKGRPFHSFASLAEYELKVFGFVA